MRKIQRVFKNSFQEFPIQKDAKTFFDLVAFGSQLRAIHLLESDVTEKLPNKISYGWG